MQHLRTFKVYKSVDVNYNKTKSKRIPTDKVELESSRIEVIDILKYWVVYSIIIASIRKGKLRPVVGHAFSIVGDNVTEGKRQRMWSKLRLTSIFVEEIFFTWLRFMPSSMTGQGRGNSPIEICYNKLSLWMKSAIHTSAVLTNKATGSQGNGSYLSWMVGMLEFPLNILARSRAISQDTKQKIITMLLWSYLLFYQLLQCCLSRSYGVIYVSLVVPAAYSIKCCDEIDRTCTNVQTMESNVNVASRLLRFRMIHAFVTWILDSFAPILAWIPLSHM